MVSTVMTTAARTLQILSSRPDPVARVRGLQVLTGNTPLLAIECEVHGRRRTIFAKPRT